MQARDVGLLLTLICFAQARVQSQASVPNGVPSQSAQPTAVKHPESSRGFVGDDACRSCHQQKIDTFYKTAYRLTSQNPDKNFVLGTFNEEANILRTSNPNLFFRMDSEKGFFLILFWVFSNMSCATCHDIHEPEHNLATFSQKCLSCHKVEACGVYPKLGLEIANNCIDCHMPNQESRVVFLDVEGKKVNPKFRTHWIKLYRSKSAPDSN